MARGPRADLPVGGVLLVPMGVAPHAAPLPRHPLVGQLHSPETPGSKGGSLSLFFSNTILTSIVFLGYDLLNLWGVEPLDRT